MNISKRNFNAEPLRLALKSVSLYRADLLKQIADRCDQQGALQKHPVLDYSELTRLQEQCSHLEKVLKLFERPSI